MRKILIGLFVFFIALPFALSFAAKYYLQHQFANNFGADIEVSKLDFEHGWFNSKAQLEINLIEQNIIIRTNNRIQHGPVIWNNLFNDPIESFALYKIDTEFELFNQQSDRPLTNQPGSATTLVSYLGTSNQEIQHQGFDLSIPDMNIFADLTEIDSEIKTDGTIHASIKANQFELSGGSQNLYLVSPDVTIALKPGQPLPQSFELNTISLSSLLDITQYEGSGIKLTSELKQNSDSFELNTILLSKQLRINQAITTDLNSRLNITNLDQSLIDFIAINFDSISQSIQNNQWLVLLKHFSDLLKLIDTKQPEFSFSSQGWAESQPIKLVFSTQLLTNNQTELNPFSLLEKLEMKLETELPMEFIKKIEQPQMLAFIQKMLEKGLLIKKHQSYYASLSFENTKLKVNH